MKQAEPWLWALTSSSSFHVWEITVLWRKLYFTNTSVGQVLIYRCALIFPPCLHIYSWHRHSPRAVCNGKVLQCQKSHCKLSTTMFGLVHSKSKTIKDKAVSVSSVPQPCLSLDRQTPLSHSGVWARHKIFRTACKLHFRAISLTGQIVEHRRQQIKITHLL